jgi:hypothetical protein
MTIAVPLKTSVTRPTQVVVGFGGGGFLVGRA